jgi:hypothetical protein
VYVLLLLLQIISRHLPLVADGHGNSLSTAAHLGGTMAPDGESVIAKMAGVIRWILGPY